MRQDEASRDEKRRDKTRQEQRREDKTRQDKRRQEKRREEKRRDEARGEDAVGARPRRIRARIRVYAMVTRRAAALRLSAGGAGSLPRPARPRLHLALVDEIGGDAPPAVRESVALCRDLVYDHHKNSDNRKECESV